MTLVFQRSVSALINGIILFSSLLLAQYFIAMILWFDTTSINEINLYLPFLFISISYSLCGVMGFGYFPNLGKKYFNLKYEISGGAASKATKALIKVSLSYLSPAVVYFLYSSNYKLFAGDSVAIDYSKSFSLYLAITAILLLPISVILSRGERSIYDIFSGMRLVAKGRSNNKPYSLKKLLFNTIATSMFIGIFATFLTIKALSHFGVLKPEASPEIKVKIKEMVEYNVDIFDQIIPNTPTEFRNTGLTGRNSWWYVDLGFNIEKMKKINKSIGIKNGLDTTLSGFAFSVESLSEPINISSLNSHKYTTLHKGEIVFTVHLFLNGFGFYMDDLKDQITKYFLTHLARSGALVEIDIIRIKYLRIKSIGNLEFGCSDEYYFDYFENISARNVELLGASPCTIYYQYRFNTQKYQINSEYFKYNMFDIGEDGNIVNIEFK